MTGGRARVSVLIPAYNYAHFVLETLESVRAQNYPDLETIVVDDGSTDSTRSLLESRSDLIYLRQDNQGLSAARNRALAAATGDYIQFLDADDRLGPGSIRRRVELLERMPSIAFAGCRSALFSRRLPDVLAPLYKEWRLPADGCLDLGLCYFNLGPPHSFLVRRASIEKSGLRFDTSLRACEDYDFWLRLSASCGLPAYQDTAWVFYRVHSTSMSKSYANQYRHDAELCRRVLALFDCAPPWMRARPTADYLTAMTAASAHTARKLWYHASEEFPVFVRGHLTELLSRLEAQPIGSRRPATVLLYVARSRSAIKGMVLHDGSLGRDLLQRFGEALNWSGLLSLRALRSGSARPSNRTLLALVRHDLLDFRHALFSRH